MWKKVLPHPSGWENFLEGPNLLQEKAQEKDPHFGVTSSIPGEIEMCVIGDFRIQKSKGGILHFQGLKKLFLDQMSKGFSTARISTIPKTSIPNP